MRKLLEKVELLRIEGIGGYIVVSLLTVLMILANEGINKRIGFSSCTGSRTDNKWGESSVPYNIGSDWTGVDRSSGTVWYYTWIPGKINAAAKNWNDNKIPGCSGWPIWTYSSTETKNVWIKNNQLSNSQWLGVTYYFKDGSPYIIRCRTEINTDKPYARDEENPGPSYAFLTVARHEWGHWFYLKHVSDSRCLMYESLPPGERSSLRPISEEDRLEVKSMYCP